MNFELPKKRININFSSTKILPKTILSFHDSTLSRHCGCHCARLKISITHITDLSRINIHRLAHYSVLSINIDRRGFNVKQVIPPNLATDPPDFTLDLSKTLGPHDPTECDLSLRGKAPKKRQSMGISEVWRVELGVVVGTVSIQGVRVGHQLSVDCEGPETKEKREQQSQAENRFVRAKGY